MPAQQAETREDALVRNAVTLTMTVIAGLAFAFSFGNVWDLATRLGIPAWIAPLVAPMVDLSVLGLLVALRYLSLRGVPAEQTRGAERLLHLCGFLTLALNVAEPLYLGKYGKAAVDSVAPLLLLCWGKVGPDLLRQFHAVRHATTHPAPEPATVFGPEPESADAAELAPADPKPAGTADPKPPRPEPAPVPVATPAPARTGVTKPTPGLAPALVEHARRIAAAHQAATGRPITPEVLRARLGVPAPLAQSLITALATG
ncbi:SpdA protein [Carbonactinospora thermoautotrophica]|uniref:DUF2637 domain-containing protein n=1 Tax=Carbonactinospora thermoautotrophica TaxID=1469144 RepID=UPI0022700C47|nr:DUF2637 domain-containing protein [Carbonactinospora thermoautotrophica]MCX9192000.1 SpdA protein [Carbonactinospora thermoautotrophica]